MDIGDSYKHIKNSHMSKKFCIPEYLFLLVCYDCNHVCNLC
uniref:Uncharacterized protein n=1 Tax=Anguilla anguilla TaxID=7936 RepID=A0A0E9WKL6_ANGAN